MKRNRLIFLMLWILSLVAVSLRGGAITYGIFLLLTFLPLISLLYIFLVILTFKVYQRVEGREIICNHNAVFYFSLQNESPFLFAGVKAEFFSSFFTISGISDGTEYELSPGSGIRKRTDMICHYRGEYEVGIKRLIVQDFLRLFSISYRNREPYKANVKPDIVHLSAIGSAETALNAVREAADESEPDLILREYVPGDDIRMINWKVSAATDKLMVRKRIGERQQGIGIIFEPERFFNEKEDYLPVENKILEVMLALSLYLSRQGMPVSVYLMKKTLEEMHVDRAGGFEDLYRMASDYLFRGKDSADCFYKELHQKALLYDKKSVFFIISRMTERLYALCEKLKHGGTAVIIYRIGDKDTEPGSVPAGVSQILIATDADLKEVM